jgi:hypothetical protein
MKKLKVKLDFVRIPNVSKVEFARNVISKMENNNSLVDPDPSLTAIGDACNELELAITDADGGGRLQTGIMRQAARKLVDLLRKLAAWVDRIADGDEVVILSSGFHPTKQYTYSPKAEFWVRNGDCHGEMIMGHAAIKKARSYIWQINLTDAPFENEGWIWAGASTKAGFRLTGLEIGKIIWFRCCGVTCHGLTPWSDPLSRMVT